ncbi:MAG TPA: EthD family reductase [Xanthobacteraceae bacterium]|jgi:uncharacterized protein (TIGR02118 family)
MAQLLVMYKAPHDAAAFDKHYAEKHIPLTKKIAGVRKYTVSKGPVATPAGLSAYYMIASIEFDDSAAIQRAFASPEGQAAAADLQNFATAGVEIFMFDSKEV